MSNCQYCQTPETFPNECAITGVRLIMSRNIRSIEFSEHVTAIALWAWKEFVVPSELMLASPQEVEENTLEALKSAIVSACDAEAAGAGYKNFSISAAYKLASLVWDLIDFMISRR